MILILTDHRIFGSNIDIKTNSYNSNNLIDSIIVVIIVIIIITVINTFNVISNHPIIIHP